MKPKDMSKEKTSLALIQILDHDRVPERPAKPGKVLTFPKRTKE
jgi:hypothetical protein